MEASAVTSFSPFCAAIFLICKEPQLYTRPSVSWFSRLKKLGSDNGGQRMLPLIARAKTRSEKTNTHTYIPKPGEESGPFPEAVLLKKVLSKLCSQPIVVYIPAHEHTAAAGSNGFIPITEYGSEFSNPEKGKSRMAVRLLYSSSNHYDLLICSEFSALDEWLGSWKVFPGSLSKDGGERELQWLS